MVYNILSSAKFIEGIVPFTLRSQNELNKCEMKKKIGTYLSLRSSGIKQLNTILNISQFNPECECWWDLPILIVKLILILILILVDAADAIAIWCINSHSLQLSKI